MAKQTDTDTAQPGAGEEGQPTATLDTLSDEHFTDEVLNPPPVSEAGADKAPETDAETDADQPKGEATDTDPKADAGAAGDETGTQTNAEETPEFDADAWATAAGIDRDLVKGCKTDREALDRVAKRLKHRQDLSAKQERELGELRKRADAPPAAAATQAEQAQVMQAMTEEQRDVYLTWHDQDPVAAERWMYKQVGEPEAKRIAQEVFQAEREKEKGERDQAAINAEWDAFVGEHPDWPAHNDAMKQVCQDIGREPVYEEMYTIALLSESDAPLYRDVVDLMKAGLTYARAKRAADAERKVGEGVKAATTRAEQTAEQAGRARTTTAGTRATPAAKSYGTLDDIPDEAFAPGSGVL